MPIKQGESYWRQSHPKTESKRYMDLSRDAKFLYLWMHKWANKKHTDNNGWFTRSIRKLAKDMSMSVNGVLRAKEELIKKDYLMEESGQNKRNLNRYRLLP